MPAADTAFRPDRPGAEPRPLDISLPDLVGNVGSAFVKDDVPARESQREKKGGRRRTRGRKQPQKGPGGPFSYFIRSISPFGWVLIGLGVVYLVNLLLAFVLPAPGRLLVGIGSVLVVVGNIWIGFVAYRDSQVFGMLCFCTFLFTYVYICVNPDETWRPAALTGFGFLFCLSGLVVAHLAGVPAP
jgi:hypothetical protein